MFREDLDACRGRPDLAGLLAFLVRETVARHRGMVALEAPVLPRVLEWSGLSIRHVRRLMTELEERGVSLVRRAADRAVCRIYTPGLREWIATPGQTVSPPGAPVSYPPPENAPGEDTGVHRGRTPVSHLSLLSESDSPTRGSDPAAPGRTPVSAGGLVNAGGGGPPPPLPPVPGCTPDRSSVQDAPQSGEIGALEAGTAAAARSRLELGSAPAELIPAAAVARLPEGLRGVVESSRKRSRRARVAS